MIIISYIHELTILMQKDKKQYNLYQQLMKDNDLCLEENEYNQYLLNCEKALKLVQSTLGDQSVMSARIHLSMGSVFLLKKQYKQATVCLNKSESILIKYGNQYEHLLNQISDLLSQVLKKN